MRFTIKKIGGIAKHKRLSVVWFLLWIIWQRFAQPAMCVIIKTVNLKKLEFAKNASRFYGVGFVFIA